MIVAIRADASLEIGTGHVMRCLTLAQFLRQKGCDVFFVCRDEDGHLCEVIESRNFRCSRLPRLPADEPNDVATFQDLDARQTRASIEAYGRPDLLVVDHYLLGSAWELILRPNVARILVIDDLGNRNHDCDLLLDQNLHDFADGAIAAWYPRVPVSSSAQNMRCCGRSFRPLDAFRGPEACVGCWFFSAVSTPPTNR